MEALNDLDLLSRYLTLFNVMDKVNRVHVLCLDSTRRESRV